MSARTIDIHVHADRDSMWEKAAQLGLKDGVASFFSHALCEVKLTLTVDEQGKTRIIAVDGRKVAD